jgi:hypothetical protein
MRPEGYFTQEIFARFVIRNFKIICSKKFSFAIIVPLKGHSAGKSLQTQLGVALCNSVFSKGFLGRDKKNPVAGGPVSNLKKEG